MMSSKTYVEDRLLDHIRLVCSSRHCTITKPDINGKGHLVHKTICMERYEFKNHVQQWFMNPEFAECEIMNDKGKCRKCGCLWKMHLATKYETIEKKKSTDQELDEDEKREQEEADRLLLEAKADLSEGTEGSGKSTKDLIGHDKLRRLSTKRRKKDKHPSEKSDKSEKSNVDVKPPELIEIPIEVDVLPIDLNEDTDKKSVSSRTSGIDFKFKEIKEVPVDSKPIKDDIKKITKPTNVEANELPSKPIKDKVKRPSKSKPVGIAFNDLPVELKEEIAKKFVKNKPTIIEDKDSSVKSKEDLTQPKSVSVEDLPITPIKSSNGSLLTPIVDETEDLTTTYKPKKRSIRFKTTAVTQVPQTSIQSKATKTKSENNLQQMEMPVEFNNSTSIDSPKVIKFKIPEEELNKPKHINNNKYQPPINYHPPSSIQKVTIPIEKHEDTPMYNPPSSVQRITIPTESPPKTVIPESTKPSSSNQTSSNLDDSEKPSTSKQTSSDNSSNLDDNPSTSKQTLKQAEPNNDFADEFDEISEMLRSCAEDYVPAPKLLRFSDVVHFVDAKGNENGSSRPEESQSAVDNNDDTSTVYANVDRNAIIEDDFEKPEKKFSIRKVGRALNNPFATKSDNSTDKQNGKLTNGKSTNIKSIKASNEKPKIDNKSNGKAHTDQRVENIEEPKKQKFAQRFFGLSKKAEETGQKVNKVDEQPTVPQETVRRKKRVTTVKFGQNDEPTIASSTMTRNSTIAKQQRRIPPSSKLNGTTKVKTVQLNGHPSTSAQTGHLSNGIQNGYLKNPDISYAYLGNLTQQPAMSNGPIADRNVHQPSSKIRHIDDDKEVKNEVEDQEDPDFEKELECEEGDELASLIDSHIDTRSEKCRRWLVDNSAVVGPVRNDKFLTRLKRLVTGTGGRIKSQCQHLSNRIRSN